MDHRSAWMTASLPVAVLSIATAFLSGCGGSDLPSVGVATYPAAGKVLRANGSPLPGGIVTFVPQEQKIPIAMGAISPDGTFQLNTDGVAPGAPAGEFKVRVELDPEADLSAFGVKRGLPFPAKYTKEKTSGLTATVQANAPNEFTFTLK